MVRRIINYVVFALAIAVGVLAVVFVSKYDEGKKEQYKAVCMLRTDEAGQKLLDEFSTVKVETLPDYLKKVQDQYNALDDSLRSQKKSADDFYTYVNIMKTTASEDFAGFKANYPANVESIMSFDKDGKYVKEFQEIANEEALANYVLDELSSDYSEFHQEYLRGDEQRTALKEYIKTLDGVNSLNDVSEKTKQMETLQSDVNNFQSMESNLLTPAFYICYILVIVTVLILVVFAVVKLVANFKQSYKALLVIAALFVVAFICYLVAGPDVNNEVFTKLQIAPDTAKLIEAGCYFAYVAFALVILAIICCPVVAYLRNRKSLENKKA